MRTIPYLFAAFVLVLCGAGSAVAQDERPPAEFAIGVSKFAPIQWDWVTDEMRQPSLDLRFTYPFSRRFALEGLATVGRRDASFATRTEGLYQIQIRQRLIRAERDRLTPFLTYGVVGYHSHLSQPAFDVPQPNGTVYHQPAFSYTEFEEPILATFGGGVQYQVASHLAVRADVQLTTFLIFPVGTRTSVGVSIPFGSYGKR